MNAQLSQEIKEILSTMKRQNKEIERFILKGNSMKVVKCIGKPKRPKFDLRELNKNLIR